ncbi:MAG: hypothetical protein EOP43_07965 [Sphingobacteriaceae bacterium]|nr:MAG: hypothetical protein EOP43_07965 [Sphingobacteriaceae bacterium]
MKNQKPGRRVQILLITALFIRLFPAFFHQFFKPNDFCNGFLHGLAITLMIGALFIDKKNKHKIYKNQLIKT